MSKREQLINSLLHVVGRASSNVMSQLDMKGLAAVSLVLAWLLHDE